MKKRMICLLCLVCLLIPLLTACRCEPFADTWYVAYFQRTEQFANGVTHTVSYTGAPTYLDPLCGMSEHFVAISFEEDGTVTFQPGTGELLTGTYTYQHNGRRSTDFTATLSNGESFTGTVKKYVGGSSELSFTFRDVSYLFYDTSGEPLTVYREYVRDLASSIRYWYGKNDGHISVADGTVTVENGKYVLNMNGYSPVVLDDAVAVRCLLLDANDQLQPLDSIREGACCATAEEYDDLTIVTIYYVEPAA